MAIIIPFPVRPPLTDRFLLRDKIQLFRWKPVDQGEVIRRVAIYEGNDVGPEQGDYALVYGPGAEWASWGLNREAKGIVLWECAYGRDLDVFPTMAAALEALELYLVPLEKRA
jgi:hypothetical protein